LERRTKYEENLLKNALIKFNDSIGSASLGIVQRPPFDIERNLLLDLNKNLYNNITERQILRAKLRRKLDHFEDLEGLLTEGYKEPLQKIYFKGALRSWINFTHSFQYYYGDAREVTKMGFNDLINLYIQLLKPMNIILDHRYSFHFLQSSFNLLSYLKYLVFLDSQNYNSKQRTELNNEWELFLDATYGFLISTYRECSIIYEADINFLSSTVPISSIEIWMIPTALEKKSQGFHSSYFIERFRNGDIKLYYRDTPITGMVVLVISVSECFPNILKKGVQVGLVNKVLLSLKNEFSIPT
jgi:hypothetical protein